MGYYGEMQSKSDSAYDSLNYWNNRKGVNYEVSPLANSNNYAYEAFEKIKELKELPDCQAFLESENKRKKAEENKTNNKFWTEDLQDKYEIVHYSVYKNNNRKAKYDTYDADFKTIIVELEGGE